MNNMIKEIPISISAWDWELVKKTSIVECEEPLISMSYLPEKIILSPQYYLQNINGSLPEIYARKTVFKKLASAAKNLPTGYRFIIFDSWRPVEVQKELFRIALDRVQNKYPSKSETDAIQIASVYVAYPESGPFAIFPHGTGGAVDLSIADENGMLLNMGTNFDDCTEKSQTFYFEKMLHRKTELTQDEEEALQNRRLLYTVMTDAGFTNYINEWWHYDYGNQNWAYSSRNKQAIYGQAFLKFPWKSL